MDEYVQSLIDFTTWVLCKLKIAVYGTGRLWYGFPRGYLVKRCLHNHFSENSGDEAVTKHLGIKTFIKHLGMAGDESRLSSKLLRFFSPFCDTYFPSKNDQPPSGKVNALAFSADKGLALATAEKARDNGHVLELRTAWWHWNCWSIDILNWLKTNNR